MQVSILSRVEGCGFSGESVQTRILRRAQDAGAPKNERTPIDLAHAVLWVRPTRHASSVSGRVSSIYLKEISDDST
jgi:hypothetical protein